MCWLLTSRHVTSHLPRLQTACITSAGGKAHNPVHRSIRLNIWKSIHDVLFGQNRSSFSSSCSITSAATRRRMVTVKQSLGLLTSPCSDPWDKYAKWTFIAQRCNNLQGKKVVWNYTLLLFRATT